MKTYLDCIPCFIRQALEAARVVTDDEEIQSQILKKALEIAANIDIYETPPAMAQHIYRIIGQLTENDDLFKDIKQRFNSFALQLYQPMKKRIAQSENPFETAVKLAIAGNIIDFGIKTTLDFAEVEKTIETCLAEPLSDKDIAEFKKAASAAESILYLGDNAGEIVFDKLLIELLGPEKITFAVRGAPVINDITMEDARTVGLTDMVKVIDNGDDAPGTILETCSSQFGACFESADLVIAKGQGNYETLSDAAKDIFFVLKAKCPAIAKHLNCKIGSSVLKRSIKSQDATIF